VKIPVRGVDPRALRVRAGVRSVRRHVHRARSALHVRARDVARDEAVAGAEPVQRVPVSADDAIEISLAKHPKQPLAHRPPPGGRAAPRVPCGARSLETPRGRARVRAIRQTRRNEEYCGDVSISISLLVPMATTIERLGIDPTEFLRAVGIDETSGPDTFVPG